MIQTFANNPKVKVEIKQQNGFTILFEISRINVALDQESIFHTPWTLCHQCVLWGDYCLLLLLFPMKICLNILEKWHPTTLSCYLWVIGIHKSISLWSFMRVYSIMRSVMMATFQVEFLIVIDYLKAFIFQNTSEVLKAIKWNWKLFRFDQFITFLKHSYRTKSRV